MSRQCLICRNSNRLEMEREYLRGENVRQIALKHDVSYHSLWNHVNNHLSRQIVQAHKTKESIQSMDLLGEIQKTLSTTKKIITRNYQKKNDFVALKAIAEARQTYELLSKIAFALQQIENDERMEQQAETEQGNEHEFSESLQILNEFELEVFNQLIEKIETQDKSIEVKIEYFPTVNLDKKNRHKARKIRHEEKKKQREKAEEKEQKKNPFPGKHRVKPVRD